MAELATNPDYNNLIMPTVVWTGQELPIKVTADSPRQYRMAVWKLATFFKKEFRYDFTQYGYKGLEEDPDHVAYLWINDELTIVGWRHHCIGAACFRKREEFMGLQWVWFHPYQRRRGRLCRAWPKFRETHSDFRIEAPLSSAMLNFLQRVDPSAIISG